MTRFLLAAPVFISSLAFMTSYAQDKSAIETPSLSALLADAKSYKPDINASSYKSLKTLIGQKALIDPKVYFDSCMALGKFWSHNLLDGKLRIDSISTSVLNLKHYFGQASLDDHPAPKLWLEDRRILQFIPRTKEQNKIIRECEQLAKTGDFYALEALMIITRPDKELADKYLTSFRKEAEKGNAQMQLKLAELMLTWLPTYQEEGLKWAEKARAKKLPHASYLLAKHSFDLLNNETDKDADSTDTQNQQDKCFSMTPEQLNLFVEAAKTGHIPALRHLAYFCSEDTSLPLKEIRKYLINEGDLPSIIYELKGKALTKEDIDLLNQAKRLDSHLAWKLSTSVQNSAQDLEACSKYLREQNNGLAITIPVEIPLSPQELRKLSVLSRTHKELSLLAQLGNSKAAIALGEYWHGLYIDSLDSPSIAEINECKQNMQHWYNMALELDEHPLAKLRLTQLEQDPTSEIDPQDEITHTLIKRCLSHAKENFDIYTIEAIDSLISDKDWNELYETVHQQACDGDAKAQLAFAIMELYNSHRAAPDADKAIAFAQLAANNGNTHGLYVISKAYTELFTNASATEMAWSYANTAAMNGDIGALSSCSYFINNNQHIIKMMADRGHLPSLLQLANQLAYKSVPTSAQKAGDMTAKDFQPISLPENQDEVPPWMDDKGEEKYTIEVQYSPQAVAYWEMAQELGSYTALDELARYYEKLASVTEDETLKQQYVANALSAGQRLLNKSDVRAYKRMARYHKEGFGLQPNLNTYKEYIYKAAALKDPESLVEKARILIKGNLATQNYLEAKAILDQLIKNGNTDTPGLYFLLGYLTEEGLGTKKDTKQALLYYLEAAEKNDAKSMNNIGSMYEAGNGVEKDIDHATQWYKKGADLGNEDALVNYERLSGHSYQK